MRKFQKDNSLEIFKTIYEAHEIVKKFIDKKEYDKAQNLLADCQETAIQLGEIIEESEGEGFVTISYLEEYCKALYETAINLSEESDSCEVYEFLEKKLYEAESSVINDIKVKLEIVFMPYKASMWDSLESVWKAADEDPECDAYVVPIPYYDRNPDHSFGEFHYEGDEYPDYVPVVHYEEYDLKKRKPDVIYIHNPYDGNNYVTSVDSRFYSSELKKYTDKLVYIPYFVLGEFDFKDEQSIEKISHFVITPAVINADKVIVQSEEIREVYIKVLLRQFGNTQKNRRIIEEKILGIGSPKFDKVVNMDRKNSDIPESWKKLIFKPDGSRKKIVLYNTGLGTLLEQNEKVIEKIREIFCTFSRCTDEVILLWRPHPLIKATIESMRPELWHDYKKLLDLYISQGWGIYDDTSDLDRAIEISDMYLGDKSSVVHLYKKTGKLVYILKYNIAKKIDSMAEKMINLYFSSAAKVNNKLFFSSVDFNPLFSYDTITSQVVYEASFEGESFNEIILFKECISYKNKIYFFPFSAAYIFEFDVITNKIIKIKLGTLDDTQYTSVWQLHQSDNDVYMVPFHSNQSIYKFNLQTKQITKYINQIGHLSNYTTRSSVLYENKIYITYTDLAAILEVDLNTNNSKLYSIENTNGFWGVGRIREDLWLIDNKNRFLLRYNIQTATLIKYYPIPNQTECIHMCCVKNEIWICSMYELKIFKFDVKSEEFTEIYLDKNQINVNMEFRRYMYYGMKLENENIIIYPFAIDKIIYIDTKTGDINYISTPQITMKLYGDLIKNHLEKSDYHINYTDISRYMDYEFLVDIIMSDKVLKLETNFAQNDDKDTIGLEIFKSIL